jgi:uncharacterized protein
MNDPKVQGQEPTMEEILASIRRIISEGEDPNAAAAALAAKPAPQPRPAPAPDGVLELTDMVGADGKVVNLADAKAAPPAQEEFSPMAEPPTEPSAAQTPEMPADDVVLTAVDPAPAPARAPDDEALIGAATAAASTAAFAALAKSMQRDSSSPLPPSIPIGSGRTLEELVAEMIRPMLKDWLDVNLPGIIERMVKREIERIVRRAED